MADKTRQRRGLGNGLGSLIPSAPAQEPTSPTRPLDVLFPGSASPSSSAPRRSGSRVSRETSEYTTPRTATLKTSKKEERATTRAVDALMSATIVSRETSDDLDDVDLLEVPGARFAILPLAQIIPNSRQPREVFNENELRELSDSIQEVGVLQPIVVRPLKATDEPTEALKKLLEEKNDAHFELIMGERRMRASELAGLSSIPAIIRDTEDDDLLRDALLENLHRVQLNPLEEASAYQQLMADFGATQEQLSKKIARSRSQIANTIRLLNLPSSVQKHLASGIISAGHARALLGFENPEDMEYLAERIVSEGLSVRTTEELVRLRTPRHQVGSKGPRTKEISSFGQSIVSRLQDVLDTKVSISEGLRKGKIVLEFKGEDDLQRIASLLLHSK